MSAALEAFVSRLGPTESPSAAQVAVAAPDYWPTAGWRSSTPAQQGMDTAKLADMVAHIQQQATDIDSMTIIRNGYAVLDVYFHPFQKGVKHHILSCTKSIVSALVGIALDKGYLKTVHQPLRDLFPERSIVNLDAHKQAITLEHLLTMTSGLKCRDSYLYGFAGLYEMGRSADWTQYMLDLPMAAAPGSRFEYCNGGSYLLSAIIRSATNMRPLDFATTYLFRPLGIRDVRWSASPEGIDIGWAEMLLTPHDMAKIGWLYLHQGRWEDQQVVSAAWVEASTRGYIGMSPFAGSRYGYQWWSDTTRYSVPNQGVKTVDYYAAVGGRGQRIFVVPAQRLVVVFTSNLGGEESNMPNALLSGSILPAAMPSTPLPADPQQQARLQALIEKAAQGPAAGFTWLSEAEGATKDGIFVRTATPAFAFDYPIGSRKLDLDTPNQVMHMRTPGDVTFNAFIQDQPAGVSLAEVGPKQIVPFLEQMGSQVRVVSNQALTLRDGTPAYRTDIKWLYKQGAPVTSLVVSAFKAGKWVVLAAHPAWQEPEDVAPIVESLTFQ